MPGTGRKSLERCNDFNTPEGSREAAPKTERVDLNPGEPLGSKGGRTVPVGSGVGEVPKLSVRVQRRDAMERSAHAAVLIGCLSLVGCLEPRETPSSSHRAENVLSEPSILAGAWVLRAFAEPGDEEDGLQPAVAVISTIYISGGQVSGSGGCNSFRARYEVSQVQGTSREGSGVLEITDFSATAKVCTSPEGVMDQEETFFELLQVPGSFDLDPEDGLRFPTNSEEVGAPLRFEPAGE